MDIDLRKSATDAAYIAVGVGVLGFQQAQVRRRETQATVERWVKDLRAGAEELAGDPRQRVEPVVEELRNRVEPVVEQLQALPEQLAKAIDAARARGKSLTGSAPTSTAKAARKTGA